MFCSITGTSNSHGWPTWSSWTTWRSGPTWPSWTTWSPWSSHGSIQPRTVQSGTSRATVSTVAIFFFFFLILTLKVSFYKVVEYWVIFFHQWSTCALSASGMGQWLPTLATGTAWSKWVSAISWSEIKKLFMIVHFVCSKCFVTVPSVTQTLNILYNEQLKLFVAFIFFVS